MSRPAQRLDELATELAREDFADLDARTARELVRTINAEDATVAAAVARAEDAVTALVEVVAERLSRGRRLFYVGAGSAGRIAALDAAELPPTYGVAPGVVTALVAGGTATFADAREGLEEDAEAGGADLEAAGVGAGDVVVGVTASGRTPYVIGAIQRGRAAGAFCAGVVNNPGTVLGREADLVVEVFTGPEVVAGSTRMKATTAQKMVLNTVSTAAMVCLGRTYGNLMVAVEASNGKLRRRLQRVVAQAAGAGDETAALALDAAGGDGKLALVMLLADVDAPAARRRLDAAGGSVRAAVSQGG